MLVYIIFRSSKFFFLTCINDRYTIKTNIEITMKPETLDVIKIELNKLNNALLSI
jgi:hypothetical protein